MYKNDETTQLFPHHNVKIPQNLIHKTTFLAKKNLSHHQPKIRGKGRGAPDSRASHTFLGCAPEQETRGEGKGFKWKRQGGDATLLKWGVQI
jgi:hypothetical protein